MPCFGFVSGHDFKSCHYWAKNMGFSPCHGKTCTNAISEAVLSTARVIGPEKDAGAKERV